MNDIFKILFLFITSVNCFSQELKVFESDSLFGYKNDTGIIIKPQYQYANEFIGNKAIVYKNNKAGVINTNNKLIIPFEYDKIYFFNDSLIYVKNRTKYSHEYNCGVLNKNNKEILPLIFSKIYLKNEKLFVEKRKDSIISETRFTDTRSIKKTYGIYKLDGSLILEPIYSWFKKISTDTLRVSKGNYYAMVKTDGNFITKLKYTAFSDFYNGKAKVRVDSLYGFINKEGKEVIPIKFKSVSYFYRDLAVYRKHSGGKLGFIDNTGKEVFESNYEILRYPHLDCAAARINKKWGLIDLMGNQLIPFIHDDYIREFEGIIAFKKNDKWAIFDSNGNQLTKYKFDSLFVFGSKESPSGSFWKLKENGFKESLAFVQELNMYAVINYKGEYIVPLNESKNKVFESLEKLKIR
tara:strand:+ start:17 stop:1243 length:1227 start_codon:yes stop_codon:yes gene_type:complete